MKTRFLLVLFALFKFVGVFSQNYVPLLPNKVVVFKHDNGSFSFVQIDSISFNQAETYYLNRVVDYSDFDCIVVDGHDTKAKDILFNFENYFNIKLDGSIAQQLLNALPTVNWVLGK